MVIALTFVMERRDNALVLRGKIVLLAEQGKNNRQIARELGIARSTVKRWKKRHEESGNLKDLRK